MGYVTLLIALGIIVLFGYWSGRQRVKLQERPKPKATKATPVSKAKRQTNLRRVK